MKEYDLVVVGSGVGLTVLNQGLQRGMKCALIEEGKLGGTCLTRGCIPSKVMVYPADLIREAEHAETVGLDFELKNVDWDKIKKRVWHQIDESKGIEKGMSQVPNLDIYRGYGEFTDVYTFKVKLHDSGKYSNKFKGSRIVLASGARAIIPPISGLKKAGFVTSRSFFGPAFPDKPWKSLIIIGGGIIAAEFAHIFSAMGTAVTIVEMLPRILSTEDPEVSSVVHTVFEENMSVLVNYRAIEVNLRDGKKHVVIEQSSSGERKEISADEVFLAVGRRSNADLLKVENAGIETDKKGWIKTNKYLETNVENVWAIGDANGEYQFRHKANHDAEVCARNIFSHSDHRTAVDYSAVPWAIFTHPQVGHVGLTEQEAISKGYKIYVARNRYSRVAKGFAMGFRSEDKGDGLVKIVIDESYKILGAHIVGPHAALLVQPFVYLMNSGYHCSPRDKDSAEIPKYMQACPGAGTFMPMYDSMVIHPSLNEVTGWAFSNMEPVNIGTGENEHHHHHEQ